MELTAIDSTADAWDAFLTSSPRGQFQQMSGWARVKALDGWSMAREYMEPTDPFPGGFQLLWKRAGPARIGYVSKGPVLADESAPAVDSAIRRISFTAGRLALSALIVQPPDDSTISVQQLRRHGYFPEPMASVIGTTGIVDLNGGREAVAGRMSRSVRKDWRSAARGGVSLRWGSQDELPRFFQLMEGSCRRQGTRPNPSRPELLAALWTAFPERVLLAFAEREGRARAGLLLIRQGRTIVFWKKGWDSETPSFSVNKFLMAECLAWAAESGYAAADVVSMSPDVAAAFVSGSGLDERQEKSRDVFNLRFGARPKPLPPAQLLVVNPATRLIVYAALRRPQLRRLLERSIG